MFNYQPLKVSDEWKLFKYNLRAIFSSKRLPMLEQRINKDTYMFIFMFSFMTVYMCYPFLLGFYNMRIIAENTAVNGLYFITILQICFSLTALQKRIQDLGIPGDVVFLIIFGILFYTNYTWVGVSLSLTDSFEIGRGRYINGLFLRTPFPFDLIQMVAFWLCFFLRVRSKTVMVILERKGYGCGESTMLSSFSRNYHGKKQLDLLRTLHITCYMYFGNLRSLY